MARKFRLSNAVNWKYSVGEIFLIVVGVSLALIVNNRYDAWQERRLEHQLLAQLSESLEDDQLAFERDLQSEENSLPALMALHSALASRAPYDEDVMSVAFLRLFVVQNARLTMAPFESLKARGLDLVANPELRRQILVVYEDGNRMVERIADARPGNTIDLAERIEVLRVLEPGTDPGSSVEFLWAPRDYESLFEDHALRSALSFRIIRGFAFTGTIRGLLEDIETLQRSLDVALD